MRAEAKAVGMREDNPNIVKLAFLVADNLDWKSNRPLSLETVSNKLKMRSDHVKRLCKSLGLVVRKRGKMYIILTETQAEKESNYGCDRQV